MLKPNTSGKADVWKKFSLVYKKGEPGADEEILNYCSCKKCYQVYQLKDSNGRPLGTKNLLEHVTRCVGKASSSGSQLNLNQCMTKEPQLSKSEQLILKRKEVEYCVEGYHSFKSVEHTAFVGLLQTCVDFGAKYGKFEIGKALYMRKTVSRETAAIAANVKVRLTERLKDAIDDGAVSLSIDMFTDDYTKKSYLDIHASWVDRDFSRHHAALAVKHFGVAAHTAVNISTCVTDILAEYGLPEHDTPVTTDHGANIVAALRNNVRVDCLCHRLHTVLESAWRDAKSDEPDAAAYETAISELCRFVKQSTGLQEQLPTSLKHGGDTRPWVSMHRRAQSVDSSYEALVGVLTAKNKLELIGNVNRNVNREMMEVTGSLREVFESLEAVDAPTMQVVAPSYYLLQKKLKPVPRDGKVMQVFKSRLLEYLDSKFWTSIRALHWMSTFVDPSFKQFEFLPQATPEDVRFRRDLLHDLDDWITAEMTVVVEKRADRETATPPTRLEEIISGHIKYL